MQGRMASIVACWALGSLAAVAVATPQNRTPFPAITGERVYVSDVRDEYDDVRQAIARHDTTSARRYYVVIVRSTGPGQFATRDYTFELDRFWEADAQRRGVDYPAGEKVLIVLGLENRQVSVLGGTDWQERYEFKDQRIDADLVQPYLLPFARRGEYAQGLVVLMNEMEHWFAAREAETVEESAAAQRTEVERAARADVDSQARARRALARKNFLSRTLPRILAVGAAGLALFAGIALWWTATRKRRAASRRLHQFKDQVVALSDRIDALKEQHRMLPFLDEDFKVPMQGETLKIYEGAQQSLTKFRDRWLQLMDSWEKAEELVKSGGAFGSAQYDEAFRLLEEADAPSLLAELEQKCALPLAALETGHERCLEGSDRLEKHFADVVRKIEQLETDGVQGERYRVPLKTVTAYADKAKGLQVADPLGGASLLEQAESLLATVDQRVGHAIGQLKRLRQAEEEEQNVTQLVADRRREGLKLDEPNGNPDYLLEDASAERGVIWEALHRADSDEAERHLGRMLSQLSDARELVHRVQAAREFCERQLGALQGGYEHLKPQEQAATADRELLESEFSASSWTGVAVHLTSAREGLVEAQREQAEARRLADPKLQHYLQAAELLQSVDRRLQLAHEMFTAVSQRLVQLRELRDSCGHQLKRVQEKVEKVHRLLEGSRADRPRSNQRFHAATGQLAQVIEAVRQNRPDWPAVADALSGAESDLDQAEELAQSDRRLAEQAAEELESASREIQRAKTYYSMGISADTRRAAERWADAQRLLVDQQYEDAIEAAGDAQRTARQAYDEAVRIVAQKEAEHEMQRRMHEWSHSRHDEWWPGPSLPPILRVPTIEWPNVRGGGFSGGGISSTSIDSPSVPSAAEKSGASQSSW
jgi:hypothetical protein